MIEEEKRIKLYLEDILESLEKIEKYSENLTRSKFKEKDIVIDAILRNIEIFGEASRKLPDNFKTQYKHIPWRKIIGLRNIILHEYSNVDLDIIWDVINKNIPKTKNQIKEIYFNLY